MLEFDAELCWTSLQAVVGTSGFIPFVMIAINFDPLALCFESPNLMQKCQVS
jgi:hypothetical protein